jgi:hypothetical protein
MQGMGYPGQFVDFIMNSLRNRESFNNAPLIDFVEGMVEATAGGTIKFFDGGVKNMMPKFEETGRSTVENILRGIDPVNLAKLYDSFVQWKEGAISFGDAWMGRTLVPSTDEIENEFYGQDTDGTYYTMPEYRLTPRQREDALYEALFPLEEPESEVVEAKDEKVGEEIQDRWQKAGDRRDKGQSGRWQKAGEKVSTRGGQTRYVDEGNMTYEDQKLREEQEAVDKLQMEANEEAAKVRASRRNKTKKEPEEPKEGAKNLKYPKNVTSSDKNNVDKYFEVFGEYPPDGFTSNELNRALRRGKKISK